MSDHTPSPRESAILREYLNMTRSVDPNWAAHIYTIAYENFWS